MGKIRYIADEVKKLTGKYQTRDPRKLCDALGIRMCIRDLGTDIKAYYYYQSRIRNIVVSNRVSEALQRIMIAHELGHDRLHKQIAMLKGFQEIELFDLTIPTEFEANIFAAELLIDDEELIEMLNDDDKSFFGVARELCVPADLLDFKFRVLKHKGYRVEAAYMANKDFLYESNNYQFQADILALMPRRSNQI